MKQKLTLFLIALFTTMGAWAETSTWESKEGWVQSTGGMGSYTWFGVRTPGDASTKYSLTAIQLMQQTGSGNNDNYLAIARVSATSTLSADYVVAISDNHLAASQGTGTLETYNFSAGVDLLGGTTYYFVFLSSKTPTNGAYPVQQGRLSLNHTDYGTYPYGNSYNMTSTHWLYYKATVESSSSGFCTGDYLGGTSPSGNWVSSWTSGTTPSFTITSSANNINNSASKPAGGLDIRSGSAKSATYTIAAPTGYVITGYKLFGKALTTNQTVTPAEGGAAVTFTTVGNSISVTGLRKFTTTFTLTDTDNSGLFLNAIQVSLASASSITALPTTNNKSYIITNACGTWNVANEATSMNAVALGKTDLDNEEQQIALIYKNENYYIFSVNANKYLTASNTLTSMPTDNEQVSITATGNATYPWFFKFKNVADKNINVDGNQVFRINSWSTQDNGNRNAVIEVADFDATTALDLFDIRTVTYKLSYEGNEAFRTEENVTVTVGGDPADFLPSSFLNDFVTLSYTPAAITAETTEVTVTATWNGPFQYTSSYNAATAKWYTVSMDPGYSSYNCSWSYKSDNSDKVISDNLIPLSNYEAVTTQRLFCFVGDAYNGFSIYNAAAGSKKLRRADETEEIAMSSTDDNNVFKIVKSTDCPDVTRYFCLKPEGQTNNLYSDDSNANNIIITGSSDAGERNTCSVYSPGQYYLNFIDELALEAPLNAVGTKAYFVSHPEAKDNILGYRDVVSANMNSQLSQLNQLLAPVKNSSTISLTDGYYRFVNAYTEWTSTAPTTYYNSTSKRIEWSVASNDSHNVNSLFKIDASTPSIYSPNAQKFMSAINSTVSGSLDSTPGTTVFTSLGSAQYNVVVGGGTMHTAGHSSGSGTSGNLTSWGGGYKNNAEAWYIVSVTSFDITLNSDGAGTPTYYATLCVPFDVTITGTTAYTLEQSGNWLIPTAVTDNKVPAGTPVVLRGSSATATATINTGVAFGEPLTCALTGTYVDITTAREDGEYIFGMVDDIVGFYKRGEGKKIGANKAYLKLTNDIEDPAVKGFVLMFDDDPDAISLTPAISESDRAIYNLAGQRMNKMQKGINIVNGKKLFVQ